MNTGRLLGTCGLTCLAGLFAGVANANVFWPPRTSVALSLADDDAAHRWYSLVPSDSPVLLPLREDSSDEYWHNVEGVDGTSAPVTVDGDPNGALTAFRFNEASRYFELAWSPAVRESGRTYSAHLAAGTAGAALEADVYYGQSSFEFTYLDATSAEFLSTVELALFDYVPTYSYVGTKCCEVVETECAGASDCYQCWDLEGKLVVGGTWDGPGMPYLTLSVGSRLTHLSPSTGSNMFEVTEEGEYCLDGTAMASGETITLTACGVPAEPPVDEASGLQPVFATSCRIAPEGTRSMATLVATRADTEAHAREMLTKIRTDIERATTGSSSSV